MPLNYSAKLMMKKGNVRRQWRKRIIPVCLIVVLLLVGVCICGCTTHSVGDSDELVGKSDSAVMKEEIDQIISQDTYQFST